MRPLRRVGHKGADLIVPGNTTDSFDAALEAGVDMIEFDVLPGRDGRLILAHDYVDAARPDVCALEQGLAHLVGDRFAALELQVDLKLPGYELRVIAALGAAGLLGRALISSQYRSSLRVLRVAQPEVRLGWSVPRLRRDPFRSRATTLPAVAAMHAARAVLPRRAASALRTGQCDALMVHWRLVTQRLVRSVLAADGELYVWTVDDLARLRRFESLGVTGVITNDPRLFGLLAAGRDESPAAS